MTYSYRSRKVIAYYGPLIITASKSRPGKRYYINTLRNLHVDTTFVVEKDMEYGTYWNTYQQEPWKLSYQDNLTICLDWCCEYYKKATIDRILELKEEN